MLGSKIETVLDIPNIYIYVCIYMAIDIDMGFQSNIQLDRKIV